MQKLGPSLKKMIIKSKYAAFSKQTVIQIGLQLIDRLHALHSIGYLHMDIKPDNLLLQSENFSSLESSNIFLIDFGISKRYVDRFGNHIKFRTDVPFQGNTLFASKNCFNNYGKLKDLIFRDEQTRWPDFNRLLPGVPDDRQSYLAW